MTIGEIGQIIGLWVGVGVSLYFSYKALRQTRELQSREYRLKLLDEVRDWARECLKLGFLRARSAKKSKNELRQLHDMYEDIARNVDTTRIASEVFGGELKEQLAKAITSLTSLEDTPEQFLDEYFNSFGDLIEIVNKLKRTLFETKNH